MKRIIVQIIILFIFLLCACSYKSKSCDHPITEAIIYDNTRFMDSLTNAELISSFQSEIDYEIRMFDTLDQLRNKSLIYAAKGNRAKSDYWGEKADDYAAKVKAKYIK